MEKTEKGFIVKLPSNLHQRLKVASSISNMTMQHITMNAIQRELGIFDSTVKIYNDNSLRNLPGLDEYKKMHIDLAKEVEQEDDLNVMEKKMEEAILNKNTEQVCYEGHHINKEEDSHEFFNPELINVSKSDNNDTPNNDETF